MTADDKWWRNSPIKISDPIFEMMAAFNAIKNERWICKNCARTVYYGLLVCPDCGSRDWHYTTAPVPTD